MKHRPLTVDLKPFSQNFHFSEKGQERAYKYRILGMK